MVTVRPRFTLSASAEGVGSPRSPFIVNVHLRGSNLVFHGLSPIRALLTHKDLACDTGFLCDHGFFRGGLRLDGTFLESVFTSADWAIHGSPLDLHRLRMKVHRLGDRSFDYVTAHPHSSGVHLSLSDPKLLFHLWYCLGCACLRPLRVGSRVASPALFAPRLYAFIHVDCSVTVQNRFRCFSLRFAHRGADHDTAPVHGFSVGVSVFIRHKQVSQRSPKPFFITRCIVRGRCWFARRRYVLFW